MYHTSEPIIRGFFSKPLATLFTFEHFRWFIQHCNETLQHFVRFWRLFRSVMWSILVLFLSLSHFSLSFLIFLIVVKFLIKQLFYSGLLDINWLQPIRRYTPRWLSIIWYLARLRRIIVKYSHSCIHHSRAYYELAKGPNWLHNCLSEHNYDDLSHLYSKNNVLTYFQKKSFQFVVIQTGLLGKVWGKTFLGPKCSGPLLQTLPL